MNAPGRALLGAEHRRRRRPRKRTSPAAEQLGRRAAAMRGVARTPGACVTSTPAERRAQAVERRDGVGREDGRAAAAERARDRGVRAEHGDAAQRARASSGSSAPSLRASTKPAAAVARSSAATSLVRPRRAGGAAGSTPSSAPTRAARRRMRSDLVVDRRLVDRARRAPPRPARRPTARSGPGMARSSAALPAASVERVGVPVGHDDAVEAPLVLEDVAQQRALGHRRAVDAVVGGHHRPRPRVARRSPRTAPGRARAACARRPARRA